MIARRVLPLVLLLGAALWWFRHEGPRSVELFLTLPAAASGSTVDLVVARPDGAEMLRARRRVEGRSIHLEKIKLSAGTYRVDAWARPAGTDAGQQPSRPLPLEGTLVVGDGDVFEVALAPASDRAPGR